MLYSHEEKLLNGLIGATADRQQILANNLANVNTPGYVRRDVDFGSILRDIKNTQGTQGADIDKAIKKAIYDDQGAKPTYEKELAEMYSNQLKYMMLVRMNGHIYKHMEEATQAGRAV